MTPRSVIFIATALVAVSGGLLTLLMLLLRAEAIEESEEVTRWTAKIVEEQCTRTIQSVELALELALTRIEALRAAGEADEQGARAVLRRGLGSRPFLRAMWILDHEGRIVFDSDEGNLGTNVSDRVYFAVHRNATTPRLDLPPVGSFG